MTATDPTDEFGELPNLEPDTTPGPIKQVIGAMVAEHDRRFGKCENFEPGARSHGDEIVLMCESCTFVIERLDRSRFRGDGE